MRSARDRERVAVPAVLGLEVDHRELAGHEVDAAGRSAAARSRPAPRSTSRTALHLVVVERQEEARQQLAVDVERRGRRRRPPRSSSGGRAHRGTASRRARRAGSRARRRAPWCGAAPASARSRRRCGARRARPVRRARRGRGPAAADGTTDCQRGRIAQTASADEADRPDRAERAAERRAVRVGGQQDVRRQQDQTGDRHAAVPDRRAVDPVEPLLDPRAAC